VDELLARFHLTDAAGRQVKGYSGGMQRRLDVALGLVHRPEVLFLDEPTTGLDPEARTAMWDEIARLAGDEGLTILLTTHYLEEADRLAGHIAIVDRGRVVVEGTPDALKGELRGDAVHVELRHPVGEAGRTLLTGALTALPGVYEALLDGRRISVRAEDGAAAVPALLAALERAGVAVSAATVARPSLDDVYLRYAGRRYGEAEAAAAVRGRPTTSPSREAPDEHQRPHPDLVHDTASTDGGTAPARVRRDDADPARDLAVPVRQPLQGGRRARRLRYDQLSRLPRTGHRRDERAQLQHVGRHGHVGGDRARHAQPVPDHSGQPRRPDERQCRTAGAHHGRAVPLIILLGKLGGADYPGGAAGLLVLVVAASLLGTVFGAFSNALGMLVRQRESIIGINTFLLLPLTFLSSAFMAPSQMPGWMRHIADYNPLNWAMVAGRSAMSDNPDWSVVLTRGGALLALAVTAVWLSIRTFRSYQRRFRGDRSEAGARHFAAPPRGRDQPRRPGRQRLPGRA
jgi:hypothetical protein